MTVACYPACGHLDLLLQLMYAAKGVGLAAPQVGVNKRLMVFNPGEDEGCEAGVLVSYCKRSIASVAQVVIFVVVVLLLLSRSRSNYR